MKVHQLHLGDERVGLLTDQGNQLLAVLANGLSPRVGRLLERMDFGGRASQCATLEYCLDVGYVMASYEAAEWLAKEGRLLLELRPWVANVLRMESVSLCDEGGLS